MAEAIEPKKSVKDKIFAVVLGLAFCGVGVFLLAGNLDYYLNGEAATAQVVNVHKSVNQKKTTFTVEFSYQVNGTSHVVVNGYGTNPALGQVGDALTIRYKSQSPDEAIVDNFMLNMVLPVGVFLVGCVVVGAGIAGLIRNRKGAVESTS